MSLLLVGRVSDASGRWRNEFGKKRERVSQQRFARDPRGSLASRRMAESDLRQKLAAILAADAVGFS
ncbi:MAG: hypothetical protein ACREQJ_17325, partial [Candidatus Binatia bacterium]